jgi:2-polyprenyl-3-methyl-5-hydroxy-6-metoxy-1,4-benzoquinol methylase
MPLNLEEVPGRPVSLDLRSVVPHNLAGISGKGPVVVTTTPDQWSYAGGFRFLKDRLPGAERIAIQVECTVRQGRIGVIVVKDDLRETLGDEERAPVDGDTTIQIVVDDVPESGWIIVRNNAPGGVKSECEIRSITIYALLPSPLRGFGEWAAKDETGSRVFEALRLKWNEVPVGLAGRRKTADLLELDDQRLERLWTETHREATTGAGYAARGWYQQLYGDVLRGKKVLDVGSGFGIDGLTFARMGAAMTFLDIAETNLQALKRLCGIFRIENANFFYLQDLNSLDGLANDFDVIWCQGSMLHVPFEFARREAQRLLQHLRIGGRWVELTYPPQRWEREGRLPFDKWGRCTDGAATPWAQWYDLERVLARLAPAEFEVVLSFNFHNDDFNWFDLHRISKPGSRWKA